MSITITVPNDDHVALRAMAKALEEIAVARGAAKQPKQIGELNFKINVDTTQPTAALEEMSKHIEKDTTSDQFESLGVSDGLVSQLVKTESANNEQQNKGYVQTEEGQFNLSTGAQVDSTGTPWDERIHSASKALNADGTWRLRRKSADKTPEEWTEYVEQVSNELKWESRQLGASEEHVKVVEEETLAQIQELIKEPAAPTNDLKELFARNEPSVTPEGDDFHVDAGEVTEQQIAAIPVPLLPVPPVPNAVTIAAMEELESDKGERVTVDEVVNSPAMSFPDVMKFLTERHTRITNDQVLEIIGAMGLKNIMDLNTQPEHTGPFIARVKALLGE